MGEAPTTLAAYVALGGALGSVSGCWSRSAVATASLGDSFPWGTLVVNCEWLRLPDRLRCCTTAGEITG